MHVSGTLAEEPEVEWVFSACRGPHAPPLFSECSERRSDSSMWHCLQTLSKAYGGSAASAFDGNVSGGRNAAAAGAETAWGYHPHSQTRATLRRYKGEPVPRLSHSAASKCLNKKHILFMGDSVTMYQYLSMAFFLKYKDFLPGPIDSERPTPLFEHCWVFYFIGDSRWTDPETCFDQGFNIKRPGLDFPPEKWGAFWRCVSMTSPVQI